MNKLKIISRICLGAGIALALTQAPQILPKAFIGSAYAADQYQSSNDLLARITQININVKAWQDQLTSLQSQSNPDAATQEAIQDLTTCIDFANKTISVLQDHANLMRQTDTLGQTLASLDSQITSLQSKIANFSSASLGIANLSAQQITAQIETINSSLADLQNQESSLTPVNTNLNVDIIQNNTRIQAIETSLGNPTSLSQTQATSLQSELDYLNAKNGYDNYYISQQSLYTNYYQKQSEYYDLQIKYLNLELTAYTQGYTQVLGQQVESQDSKTNADFPVLNQELQINRNLVKQFETLTSFQSQINQVEQERDAQLDLAQKVSTTIDTQIEVLKGTLELNVLINQQKSFLPNVGQIESYASQINAFQVQNFQLLAMQQQIASPSTYIDNLESTNRVTFTAEQRQYLETLLSQRSELIAQNLKLLNQVIVETTKVENLQNELVQTITNIDDKLNQQDFFVRSTPSISLNWIKNFTYGVLNQWQSIQNQFTFTFGSLLFYLIGLVSIIFGLSIRSGQNRIIAQLEVLRNRVNNRKKDSFIVTPLAIGLTLLASIYRSFIWGGIVLIIFNTIFRDTSYVIDYFGYTFIFLMFLTFTLNLLRPGGVLNSHFSPLGSYYAKNENEDFEPSDVQPQPRVPFTPVRIFTSSQVAAITDKSFVTNRLDYLAEIERHEGVITKEQELYDPHLASFEPVSERVVCAESVPVLDPSMRKTKVVESEKYSDIPEAPVKQLFVKAALFSNSLRNFLLATAIPIFVFVNIMYFNLHPTVTPSENIIGQALYVVAFLYILIMLIKYTRQMNATYRASHGYLDYFYKTGIFFLWLVPIVLLIMVAYGFVNTTTVILQHILYSYYGVVILILVTRVLQRELAVFNLINSRKAQPEVKLTADDLDDVQYAKAVSDNVFVQQRQEAKALFTAHRDAYFAEFSNYRRFANLLAWIVGLIIFYLVWADLVSVVNYLDKVTIWQVSGAQAGTLQNITLLNALKALISILVTFFIWKNLKTLLDIFVFAKLKLSDGLPYAIQTVSAYILFAIGFSIAVGTLGLSWSKLQWLLSALLLGLSFGLQEIFTNFVAGFIILFERPIRIGDYVTISGNSGSIKSIRIRATTIVDSDNKEIIIPNKTFVTSSFTNWTLSESRTRLVFNIGVAYGSDVDLVTQTLIEAANLSPQVIKDKYPPTCYFSDFGASTLNFVLRCHVPVLGDRVPTTHDINRTINRLCNERGIDIAFNQLDVYIKNGSGLDVKVESTNLLEEKDK
ncbi:hypothetical protein CJP74_01910 [Psittacicella melopsittaci]|uniref:Mechanosensitive ion channel n=1 Tax=Psittacicella melopsittaci TaxID=2028576 RepID=A0A3A1Y7S9_9GAMM|nr:mechanosensitive ion channel domain-containing protein [Psittacicella melopsittaci]RIY33366.1 hypothetical protein CJP74_01910 [Psittacicella melopsittaci]